MSNPQPGRFHPGMTIKTFDLDRIARFKTILLWFESERPVKNSYIAKTAINHIDY